MNRNRNKAALKSAPRNFGIWFVTAQFDFSPSVSDELNLEVGDVIKVHERVDDFWMKGLNLNSGKQGQFPLDFVKDIAIPKHSKDETLLYALDAFYPEVEGDLSFNKGDIIVLEKKVNNEWGMGRSITLSKGIFPLNYADKLPSSSKSNPVNQSPVRRVAPAIPIHTPKPVKDVKPEVLGKGKAIMNLTAQLDEELSFQVGDEITITGVSDDGQWYEGTFGSESGTFPSAFIKLEAPLRTAKIHQQHLPVDVSLDHTGNKQWKEVEIDVVSNNAVNLDNHSPAAETSKDTSSSVNRVMSEYCHTEDLPKSYPDKNAEDNIEKQKNILYTVEALHNFAAASEQELSFHKGTPIDIFEEVDDHWLMGKVGDLEGYIARAYVSKVSTTSNSVSSNLQSSSNNASNLSNHRTNNNNNNELYSTPIDKNSTSQSRMSAKQTISNALNKHVDSESSVTNDVTTDNSVFRKALVVYDYERRNQHDLSVTKNDLVLVVREVDSDWCEVENNLKQRGIIPTSYVEFVPEEKSDFFSKNSTSNIGPKDIDNQSYKMLQSCHENTVLPSVPEHSHADGTNLKRSLAFSSPTPFHLQKPRSFHSYQHQTNRGNSRTIQKSISVDFQKPPELSTNSGVRRSNSNPHSWNDTSAKDAMVHLKAWQLARRTSDITPKNARPQESATQEVCTENRRSYVTPKSSHAINRSSSMRERNTIRRYYEDRVSSDTNFVKIKSDSNLYTDKVTENGRPRSTSPKKRPTNIATLSGNSTEISEDLSSAVSTTSSSSIDDPRTRLSDSSSTASNKSMKSTSKTIQKSAPPVPPHSDSRTSTPDQAQNSIWSPPVPQRKQSLQHMGKRKSEDNWSSTPFENEVIQPQSLTPSRPAPQLPPPRKPPTPVQKKIAPQRPANPPKANGQRLLNGGTQERVQVVTSKQIKEKMEKLRSDIEDYSRMKRDLETLYQGTLDGKERKEISENLEFVKSNIRRLQNEFHNVIGKLF